LAPSLRLKLIRLEFSFRPKVWAKNPAILLHS